MKRRKFLMAAPIAIAVGGFPKKAHASHHRQHVRDFLFEVLYSRIFLNSFYEFLSMTGYVEGSDVILDASISYIQIAQVRIWEGGNDILDIMDNGSPNDLFRARRIISAPRFDQDDPGLLLHAKNMIGSIGFFVDLVDDATKSQYRLAMRQMDQIWENLDFATWHINDAIMEEFYDDPNFGE